MTARPRRSTLLLARLTALLGVLCLVLVATGGAGHSAVRRSAPAAAQGTLRQLLDPGRHAAVLGDDLDPGEELAGQQAFAAAHEGGNGLATPTTTSHQIARGISTAARISGSSTLKRHWTLRGPKAYYANDAARSSSLTNEGFQNLAGRVTTLATTPSKPNLVWAGAAGGGAWRSTDGGKHWTATFDKQATTAIGSIAIDPTDSKRVYVGTGEANTNADAYFGDGIYVTSNSGRSWHRVGLKGVLTVFHVEAAAPSPGYPQGRVFAATNNGLWLSTDRAKHFHDVALPTNAAHNGVYTKTAFGNFVSDVRVRPHHPSQVVAVVGWRRGKGTQPNGLEQSVGNGFYSSTASGKAGSFHFVVQKTGVGLGTTGNDANPFGTDDPIGRTSLAYSADGKYLWAVVEDAGNFRGETYTGASLPATVSVLNGVYVSTTADPSRWTPKGNVETFAAAEGSSLTAMQAESYGPGVQAWYDQWVAVDPTNDNRVLVGLEEVYQSTAGATLPTGYATWKTIARYWNTCAAVSAIDCSKIASPVYAGKTTHPDQHAVAFAPASGGHEKLYTGSDGGVFSQVSHTDGYDNKSWSYLNVGLPTTQPYYAAESSDGTIYAGLQDNGEVKIQKNGTRGDEVFGGDGFDTAVVPNNSKQAYEEYTYGDISVTKDGGLTWTDIEPGNVSATTAQFATPFVLDPKNSNHIVEVGRYVDETTAGTATTGSSWKTVFDLGASQVADKPGVSGSGVNDVATSVATSGKYSYVPFCGLCDPVSSGNGDLAYFHHGLATNVKAHCTAKEGSSACWHKVLHTGLPNRYVQGVAIDPKNPRTVYVALAGYTRRWLPNRHKGGSVYVSHDAGSHFRTITGNLPAVPANALVIRNGSLFVGTDRGLYVSKAGTKRWTRVGKGLPNASVLDLRLNPNGSQLVAALHGRGVWTYSFGHAAKPVYRQHGPAKGKAAAAAAAGAAGSGPSASQASSASADGRFATGSLPLAAGVVLLLLAAGLTLRSRRAPVSTPVLRFI